MHKLEITIKSFVLYMLLMVGIGGLFGHALTERHVYNKVNEDNEVLAQTCAVTGYTLALKQITRVAKNPEKENLKKIVDSTVWVSKESGVLIKNIEIPKY